MPTLARRLVRQAGTGGGHARSVELERRTRLVLRNGHLAQHLLYHPFHGPGLPHRAQALFGVSPATFAQLRQDGRTPLQIADGRAADTVAPDVVAVLARSAGRGVSTRSTSAAQSRVMLARQRRTLTCWLTTPLAKLDPTSPFGDPDGGHGSHRRGSRVGVRPDSGLGAPGGCWRTRDPDPPKLAADLAALARRLVRGTTPPPAG